VKTVWIDSFAICLHRRRIVFAPCVRNAAGFKAQKVSGFDIPGTASGARERIAQKPDETPRRPKIGGYVTVRSVQLLDGYAVQVSSIQREVFSC